MCTVRIINENDVLEAKKDVRPKIRIMIQSYNNGYGFMALRIEKTGQKIHFENNNCYSHGEFVRAAYLHFDCLGFNLIQKWQ